MALTLQRWTPLLIALAVGLSIAALRLVEWRPLELLELRALDYRFLMRGPEPPAPEVLVVGIDDASLAEFGRWPWPRSLVAALLDGIGSGGAAVIGVDMVQSEATASCELGLLDGDLEPACRAAVQRAMNGVQGEDARLAEVVRASERTVLGYFFDFRRDEVSPYAGEAAYQLVQRGPGANARPIPNGRSVTRNIPVLTEAARASAYFNFLPDRDGLYRRAALAIAFDDRVTLPLSLAMLQLHWPKRPPAIRIGSAGVESVRLGELVLPVDERGQLLINYRGPGQSIPHVSAADVLTGRAPADVFRDKLVVLGVTAIGVGDVRATPFSGVYPGPEIHATVLDNVLRGDFVYRPTWAGSARLGLADVAVILALALVLGAVLQASRGLTGALAALALLVGYTVASQVLFTRSGLVLGAAYPALAVVLTYVAVAVQHYVVADREKRETRRMLDLYLSPALSEYVSEHPEMLALGGEKWERSVLFSDIKGFTNISEALDPHDLVELLNVYLGAMTDIVFAHDGMLDKYIGDAVMAVWGAPVHQPDHAARACRTALAMVESLAGLNERGREHGWPELRIRIGLNSGPMVFGNMGSPGHLSLTVMGDAVNLGSRLEGINKLYGTTIIASQFTVREAGDAITTRELDRVRVRGKAEAVHIYEVLGPGSERERWRELVEVFERGLGAYRNKDWEAGIAAFERVLALRENDGPAALYLRRCRDHQAEPPAEDWEAVTGFGEG